MRGDEYLMGDGESCAQGASMQRGPDCLSGSNHRRDVSLDAIVRREARRKRPAPPPFSFIIGRRWRWSAA
jgi:hypothetical protein